MTANSSTSPQRAAIIVNPAKPVDIDQLISVLRVSVQRADANRLALEPVINMAPVAG